MAAMAQQAERASPIRPKVVIHEILWLTDLSPESDTAFEHARFLAERFGARLTLYHAVEPLDHRYAHWNFTRVQQIWRQAESAARDVLDCRTVGVSVPCEVRVERVANASQAVFEASRVLRPDLIVMATHGREGPGRWLLGSVTEEIIRRHRPVLSVRKARALPYRRIVVPTDFSVESQLALPIASLFATAFEAEVLGLHVVPPVSEASAARVGPPPVLSVPSEALLRGFLRADSWSVPFRAQIQTGPVWERIVHTAAAEQADLIVMATRGHDSWSDRILGSNTERVMRHAPCPVLVA